MTPGVHSGKSHTLLVGKVNVTSLLHPLARLFCNVSHFPCLSCLNIPILYVALAISVVSCRYGFLNNLTLGGPTPIGARKAPLSDKYLSMMQEVALNEQVPSHL